MPKRFLHYANETLALLLELFAFGALIWWGFHTGHGLALHLLLGLGSPVAAAVLWGLFAAPKARFQPGLAVVLLVKALVYAGAVAGLHALGHHLVALAFAIVAAVNTAYVTVDRNALVRRSHGY